MGDLDGRFEASKINLERCCLVLRWTENKMFLGYWSSPQEQTW